jgi:hypothetical protein
MKKKKTFSGKNIQFCIIRYDDYYYDDVQAFSLMESRKKCELKNIKINLILWCVQFITIKKPKKLFASVNDTQNFSPSILLSFRNLKINHFFLKFWLS